MSNKNRKSCPQCKTGAVGPDAKFCSWKCSQEAAKVERDEVKASQTPKEKNEVTENTWEITTVTQIHTLPALLKHFEVDESVWEVERFVANKWEMGYVRKADKVEWQEDGEIEEYGGSGEVVKRGPGKKKSSKSFDADSKPLYQVKAFLRKKRQTVDHYAEHNTSLMRQLAKTKDDLERQKKYVGHLAKNHAGYDDLLGNVKDFVKALDLNSIDLPRITIQAAAPLTIPPVKDGHSEDAVLLLSDTHFGDVIRREDTSGFPEFDLVIAGNRFGYIIGKAKQCLSLHRAMYPIKRLYVWVGGDIGNGILHDSPNSNALFTPAQVHFSYNMFKFAINDLLTLTVPDTITGVRVVEEIVLLFTVGNHMRMDIHMPHKYQAQRTLDWLIYQGIIEKFEGHPNVVIRKEMSPYIFETIRGHRHLFCHGMQVGYRNSPDAQVKSMGAFIDRVRALFDSPEWRRKNGFQGETFARACIGDIHIPVRFPRLVSNGSLNGQNELGVNWMLEPIPVGQQLFGVSEKHLETWAYFLEATHIQREASDFNSYGMYAAEYAKQLGRC